MSRKKKPKIPNITINGSMSNKRRRGEKKLENINDDSARERLLNRAQVDSMKRTQYNQFCSKG